MPCHTKRLDCETEMSITLFSIVRSEYFSSFSIRHFYIICTAVLSKMRSFLIYSTKAKKNTENQTHTRSIKEPNQQVRYVKQFCFRFCYSGVVQQPSKAAFEPLNHRFRQHLIHKILKIKIIFECVLKLSFKCSSIGKQFYKTRSNLNEGGVKCNHGHFEVFFLQVYTANFDYFNCFGKIRISWTNTESNFISIAKKSTSQSLRGSQFVPKLLSFLN